MPIHASVQSSQFDSTQKFVYFHRLWSSICFRMIRAHSHMAPQLLIYICFQRSALFSLHRTGFCSTLTCYHTHMAPRYPSSTIRFLKLRRGVLRSRCRCHVLFRIPICFDFSVTGYDDDMSLCDNSVFTSTTGVLGIRIVSFCTSSALKLCIPLTFFLLPCLRGDRWKQLFLSSAISGSSLLFRIVLSRMGSCVSAPVWLLFELAFSNTTPGSTSTFR